MRLQYLWHTDNWCITLEEPQLKALQGKKLKINVRLGERWQPDICLPTLLPEPALLEASIMPGKPKSSHGLQRSSDSGALPGSATDMPDVLRQT